MKNKEERASEFLKEWGSQLLKYSSVGVINTILTAGIIYIAQEVSGLSIELSNLLGYAGGLISSFVLNSRWTFGAKHTWGRFLQFILIFLFCYAIQFGALTLMQNYTEIPNYTQQLLTMVVFSAFNFVLNKLITFRA
ncbi:MAG: GtrA family protein [Porphyromonas sp.]|nr:GtrA family protein [Porphyromonas sp.]